MQHHMATPQGNTHLPSYTYTIQPPKLSPLNLSPTLSRLTFDTKKEA